MTVAACGIPEVPQVASWGVRSDRKGGRSNDSFSRSSSKEAPMPVGRLAPGVTKQGHIQQVLWKTTQCAFFAKGCCKKGSSCSFAHGSEDTRARPDLTKTVMCSSWQRRRMCKAGDACNFAHGQTDLRRRGDASTLPQTPSWKAFSDADSSFCRQTTIGDVLSESEDGTRTPSLIDEETTAGSFTPTMADSRCDMMNLLVPQPVVFLTPLGTPTAAVMNPLAIQTFPDSATPAASPPSSPTGAPMEVDLLKHVFGIPMMEALHLHAGTVGTDLESRETSQRIIQKLLESAAPDHYED